MTCAQKLAASLYWRIYRKGQGWKTEELFKLLYFAKHNTRFNYQFPRQPW